MVRAAPAIALRSLRYELYRLMDELRRSHRVRLNALGGNRAADLLFERLEQAGREDEHHRPQHVERVVVGVRQPLRRQDLEAVRAETDDDQSRANGPRTFGYGKLLGGACPLFSGCG